MTSTRGISKQCINTSWTDEICTVFHGLAVYKEVIPNWGKCLELFSRFLPNHKIKNKAIHHMVRLNPFNEQRCKKLVWSLLWTLIKRGRERVLNSHVIWRNIAPIQRKAIIFSLPTVRIRCRFGRLFGKYQFQIFQRFILYTLCKIFWKDIESTSCVRLHQCRFGSLWLLSFSEPKIIASREIISDCELK